MPLRFMRIPFFTPLPGEPSGIPFNINSRASALPTQSSIFSSAFQASTLPWGMELRNITSPSDFTSIQTFCPAFTRRVRGSLRGIFMAGNLSPVASGAAALSDLILCNAALPHLFERFYRGEKSRSREHGGAGIGLAIVKELIEAHGGRVGAEILVDRTKIWFTLPTSA